MRDAAKHTSEENGSSANSHSQLSIVDAAKPSQGLHRPPPAASLSEARPSQPAAKFEIDLTDSDNEQIVQDANVKESNHQTALQSSRYFGKTKHDPRRVSLDADETPIMQESDSPPIQPSRHSMSQDDIKDWDSDEILESPKKQPATRLPRLSLHSNNLHVMGSQAPTQRPLSKSRQTKNKSAARGTLLAGFQRQQEFFGHLKQSSQRRYTNSSARKAPTMKSLTSYFLPSPEATKVQNKPQFSQLALNTNQTDDDFMWNG